MAGKKMVRLAIRMVSMAGTGFEYVTMKNPKNTTWKLRLVKYDPIVRQRVLFKEEKLSRRKVHKRTR
eukprot:CAMPEP_0117047406 /NCGR_PEP_ID=MMETSP0472-20121206/32763_1 /TAXON_ID=693140 ORGANISM="Tiarina fusus, Strain LIS" /NCGR_SAMPLE_ID=MMETSP0472 /ASSEMBLY_ACC=CAM_ASM_000603 /LENGTH=66 /DNA_ID=CAMNT_0004760097 /DNA_START=8 /DNA_END=208 /DNA_ORIENTATION=-